MKKPICILVFCLILFLAAGGIWLFLLGEAAQGDDLIIQTAETQETLQIRIHTAASAIAFTGARLHRTGTVLDITFRCVPVSPVYSSGQKVLTVDKNGLTEIRVAGRIIWTR